MSNTGLIPLIRFPEFTEPWEQRKLSEVLDIVNDKNEDRYGKEDVLSVSDEYGCINQIRFQGRSFAGEDISNYKVVRTGDIIYTRSPLKSKPYGIIKVVGAETGIVSPLYIVNKPKEGYDSKFIYRVFDSPEKTNNYLSPLVRKGAKNTMNISNDEWLSGEIFVSPSYAEQNSIGLFFEQFDKLIALHERKLESAKKLKKFMLQKMFPKDGEIIPEIRFPEFTDSWEQRKLGEVLKFQNGFNGGRKVFGEGVPLISVMDILNNQFITYDAIRGKATVTDDEYERYAVRFGDVLFQRSSENVEDAGSTNVYIDTDKTAIFGGFVIRGKQIYPYSPKFMKYLLDTKTVRNQITQKAQGAQHVNVSQETLQDVMICLPSETEQIKIENCLFHIDNLITLHQRKCNELINLKKFMLQNMFI